MAREESFWGGDRIQRLHPRLVAEMLLDSFEYHREPALMMRYLRDAGYHPDYVRSKGYLGANGQDVVLILPFVADDLASVAGMGVRRRVDGEDEQAAANATIVRMAHGVNPVDFTALTIEKGEVLALGPARFDELVADGVRSVAGRLAPGGSRFEDGMALNRLSRGRAIAAAAIEDLATEERDIGFISQSEYQHLLKDSELYADVARVHSYLSLVSESKASAGCSYCTSTSSYVCTSTSCFGNVTIKAAQA